MTWEMYQKKVVPHRCDFASMHKAVDTGDISEGDIIKCADCGALHELYLTDGGMQWDPTPRTLQFRRYNPPTTRYGMNEL